MTALAGLRVLDASTVVMGPYATRLLTDLGADVLKVEPPEGDVMRRAGQGGAIFAHLNRGKRSVALDLKAPEGQAEFRRLAAEADVLVHNMRPEAAARLGLRQSDLAALNPRLVVACAYGYGAGGPYAARPAYDDLIQAASGLADTIGRASGDGEPRYVPLTLADRVVGAHLAFAIVAAIACRERTGVAQEVEVPMFETFAGLVAGDHLGGMSFDPPEGEAYYPRLMSSQRRPYRTRDGWIAVLLYTDAHWRRFFTLIGREDALEDPRLATHAARQAGIDHAYAQVAEALADRDTAEWMRLLSEADIPAAPVNDIAALRQDPHLNATGFWRDVALPDGRTLHTTAPFGRWSATPPAPPGPPPAWPAPGTAVWETP
jgi:crotonobetainyl-CoA:carnitine CoA-transferase CaiB-like acyl-CoA transferase